MDCTVIIGTYGDTSWLEHSERCAQSVWALRDRPTEILKVHGDTLASARNGGGEMATTEWLCFLDADDELAEGYFTAMQVAIDSIPATDDALAWPHLRRMHPDGSVEPERRPPHPNYLNLRDNNWMVIGTLVRRQTFLRAGGFVDWPAWEDWALWMRCDQLGAAPLEVPSAVYVAHVDDQGRNSTVASPQKLRRNILRSHDEWVFMIEKGMR